jgi:hypothetical protein
MKKLPETTKERKIDSRQCEKERNLKRRRQKERNVQRNAKEVSKKKEK